MSFIALPYEFDPATGMCRGFQIVEGSDMEPVGMMRGGRDLPVDLEKLSQNFAAMLNGHGPLHLMHSQHQMFFERHAEGFNFRFRDAAKGGTSEIGALFTLMPGIEMEFAE